MLPDSFRRILPAGLTFLVRIGLVIGVLCTPALAQEEAAKAAGDHGSIAGHVLDSESGSPLEGVRVIVTWPAPADGSEPREEVQTTTADGGFEFKSIPPGTYTLEGVKKGFSDTTLRNLEVHTGDTASADLRMLASNAQPAPPPDVEEFLVLGVKTEAIEASRQESNQMINTLSSEEIAKYSASDIADVILRVPGVNVVEGQFAIIRGLEDRYSSTLYNSAPIPSPDPDRQSPQLDLFPTEIVSDLVVAKTFGPEMPSNSSGGSINVLTASYPEVPWEISVKAKGGWNDNAIDDFLSLTPNSPVGDERNAWNTIAQEYGGTIAGRKTFAEREFRYRLLGNWGVDYDSAFGWQEGREPRTNTTAPPGDLERGDLFLTAGRFDLTTSERTEQTTGFGAFGFDFDTHGDHGVDFSVFYTKKDNDVVQDKNNGYFPNFDYNAPGGPVDVQNRFPSEGQPVDPGLFDGAGSQFSPGRGTLSSWILKTRDQVDQATKGLLWLDSFNESKSFKRERDLLVPQVNGHNNLDSILPGLSLKWVANYARTTQKDNDLGARMFFEPCGFADTTTPQLNCPEGVSRIPVPTQFPVKVVDLGPGAFVGNRAVYFSDDDIKENQEFGRIDGEYARDLTDWAALTLDSGGWYEHAKRDIDASFLPQQSSVLNPACPTSICVSGGPVNPPAIFGDSLKDLGKALGGIAFLRDGSANDTTNNTTSDAERTIKAAALGAKTTLWQDLDLLGGVRLEHLNIKSNNDPFNGLFDGIDHTPAIYPTKWLMFDRFGDNQRREGFVFGGPFNDQVIGLKVKQGGCRSANAIGEDPTGPVLPGPCVDLVNRGEIEQFVNGEIDESKYLPSVALNYRPIEGMAVRGAWSKTVARPSFREMGYYVTVEPGSDDLIVGNPQLQLSDVESYDGRVEYVYGESGDLVAASGFYKLVDDPIEQIILRDPTDFSGDFSQQLFRTFFNNPNQAKLWGIELEARKNFGFVREAADIERWNIGKHLGFLDSDLFDYLTIGSNFTWINAKVKRTEAELQRSERFFEAGSGHTINNTRRLYGQPKWIVNADITYNQPDWGTRATLAFFAISDVLDAAGAATIGQNRDIVAITLDRYIDSFQKLDFTVKQELGNGLSLKFAAKNLIDGKREIVYDPSATHGKFTERSYRVGRDYSFELTYTFSELPFFSGGGGQ